MSAPPEGQGEPITDRRQLVEYFEQGCKPKADWRIGTEHEKFGFHKDTLRPLAYDEPGGIRDLLTGMAERFDWQPVEEAGKVIALKGEGGSITLEPGGQFELSGAPLQHIHHTCSEVHNHLSQVREIADPLNVGMLGMGFQPKWPRDEIPWMPKGRYRIMGAYMPKVGKLGLDMMLRTCTIQVNLDFSSEADMVKKLRVGLALQPVATALFANSPFSDGKPNGFLSYRSQIWTDTDPDRCGILPFVFEDGMGFERYAEHVLDVPMYFVYRDGQYIDASGQSFRDFLDGRLPALPGERPTISDWADHITTLFPEARLKRYIEMRGADGGPWRNLCALPALWVGLLYDQGSLDAAWDLAKDWTIEEHEMLRREVPKTALHTKFRNGTLQDIALRMMEIADAGLAARGVLDWDGSTDERKYIRGLWDIARSGTTRAEELLQRVETEWGGHVDPVFEAYAY
ncbi:MAG: glutamate--cysteine ligase [Geminicoccaceae bacterium]|nr:glutamate--cysteine ligase [Geminicoccaceae bacterium]